DLDVKMLFDDPQRLVASSRSKWANRRAITLGDLVDEPWILPKPTTTAGGGIAATFSANGLQMPQPENTSSLFTVMNALIARGPFLAFWPASVLHFSARKFSVKALPVKLPQLPAPVGIIALRGRTISPAAQAFIECAREIATPLAGSASAAR